MSASGKGVSARALTWRTRTVRNCPRSPASKPGGKNRSRRGSDSCSATAWSITPVLAQNRRNSHIVIKMASTVPSRRILPLPIGDTSSQCLKEARPGKSIVFQSTPRAWHQLKNTATLPV